MLDGLAYPASVLAPGVRGDLVEKRNQLTHPTFAAKGPADFRRGCRSLKYGQFREALPLPAIDISGRRYTGCQEINELCHFVHLMHHCLHQFMDTLILFYFYPGKVLI